MMVAVLGIFFIKFCVRIHLNKKSLKLFKNWAPTRKGPAETASRFCVLDLSGTLLVAPLTKIFLFWLTELPVLLPLCITLSTNSSDTHWRLVKCSTPIGTSAIDLQFNMYVSSRRGMKPLSSHPFQPTSFSLWDPVFLNSNTLPS